MFLDKVKKHPLFLPKFLEIFHSAKNLNEALEMAHMERDHLLRSLLEDALRSTVKGFETLSSTCGKRLYIAPRICGVTMYACNPFICPKIWGQMKEGNENRREGVPDG
jgi:hypothetical protein